MKLTPEQATERLNSSKNAINIIHKQLYGGRAKGIKLSVPPTIRSLIGITANRDGSREAGKAFGVSSQLALAAGRGQIIGSDYKTSREDKEVKARIESDLKEARAQAISRTLAAMNSINDEDFQGASLRDKAGVARDLAAVYDKLSNKAAAISGSGATVIIYSPRRS